MNCKKIYNRAKRELASYGVILDENLKRLKRLENKHSGQKAVIVGMGPSLSIKDLEKMNGYVFLACNKIYLAYQDTDWRPNYYTVSDSVVANNNYLDIINEIRSETIQLYPQSIKSIICNDSAHAFYSYTDALSSFTGSESSFSRSLCMGICGDTYTVVIEQLQLAHFMGFNEVYVVGLDFSFDYSQCSKGGTSSSGDVLVSTGERNHFHKDYRKPGETWTVPKLDEQRVAFRAVRSVYENSGRKLYNASRQTQLDVLERVDINTLLI